MKKIRIFFASSIVDLKFDRIEIGNFFRQLNDAYIENGIYFELIMCEDYDNSISLDGKQSELDRLICESEIVFFVFFTKVGEVTKHEFDIALENYKNCNKPKIVTYFKCIDAPESAADDVRQFMTMLDSELRHYYNIYREIDTLKLGMFMQIKLMRLDSSELKVENGSLMHGKTVIADTEKIPMFRFNERLNELKARLASAEEKYRAAKVAFLKNGSDDDYLLFSDAASEKENAEKSLRELESAILSAAEKMYKNTTDGSVLSEKQKQAYRYMESGEWELALAILDKEDILSELSHNESLEDGIRERIVVNVGELMQRIEVLTARGLDTKSIDEVLSIYAKVYDIVLKYSLDSDPIFKYSAFLHELNRDEEALRITEKLIYIYSDPDREVKLEKLVELYLQRAKIFYGLKRFGEAINILKEGMPFANELFADDNAAVISLCADMRNVLANALFFLNRMEEARVYYEEAMRYYEIAYSLDKQYKSKVAMIYDNYANVIDDKSVDLALKYHLMAESMYFELASEDDKKKKPLSRCYHNTALHYEKIKQYDVAEKYFLESIKIREEIRKNNPMSIEPMLSGSYYSLGVLYENYIKDKAKAIDAYKKSFEIRILLRKRSKTYARELSDIYARLLYSNGYMKQDSNEFRIHYINALRSLDNITDHEKKKLCEEIYLFLLLDTDTADRDMLFELLKEALDIYAADGDEGWYVELDLLLEKLKQLACALGRLTEYIDCAAKIDKKRKG